MVFVDSNVFVIALRYPRDANAPVNGQFLEALASGGDGVTSALNLLEVCGILSFNLSDQDLLDLFHHFGRRFKVSILPRGHETGPLATQTTREVLARLRRGMSVGDALVAEAVERVASRAAAFVSWNARHFQGRLAMPAVTPAQWLEAKP